MSIRWMASAMAALLCFTAVAAGFEVKPIEAKHPRDQTLYRFPNVRGPEPAAAAINIWLQAIELNKLPGRYSKTAFEDVWPAGDSYTGVTELDYKVETNNERYLALRVTGEYSAAYPSGFDFVFNFDTTTGAPISLRDLFTPGGLQQLRALVATRRVAAVRAYLKTLATNKDEDAEDRKALYEECLPEIRKDDLDANEMEIRSGTLTLSRGDCGPHVSLALEDLGAIPITVSVADMSAGLNDYGRCLLGAAGTAAPCKKLNVEALDPGVYRGTVGKSPVTLVIGRKRGGHIDELGYFYDKYAKWIELSGEQRPDGAYWFHETAGEQTGSADSRFVLRADDSGKLVGSWSSASGKTLPAALTPLR